MVADDNRLNASCIRCHVQTVDEGMSRPNMHWPFFEQQCIKCHLADNSPWTGETRFEQAEGRRVTGKIVTQEHLWRRRKVIRGPERTVDHLIAVPGLDIDLQYRFRIVVRDGDNFQAKGLASSKWMGLVVREVPDLGRQASAEAMVMTEAEDETIHNLTIYRAQDTNLFISWRTPTPVFGEIQLEELEGVDFAEKQAGETLQVQNQSDEKEHPALRTPEYISIDICYSCHPKGALGVSHPVGIYAQGKEIRIPDNLPTVNDGMLTCVTCHNPHGSAGKKLVREVVVTKLCVACHISFAGTSKSTIFRD